MVSDMRIFRIRKKFPLLNYFLTALSSNMEPMTSQQPSHEKAHGESEPVTDHVHANSWSANLEEPQYEGDLGLLKQHAIDAVKKTESGYHVNLVTHEVHGHPETYLFDTLEKGINDEEISWEYIDQCGCGGHVVRVHV